jgi:hypothetical protein
MPATIPIQFDIQQQSINHDVILERGQHATIFFYQSAPIILSKDTHYLTKMATLFPK